MNLETGFSDVYQDESHILDSHQIGLAMLGLLHLVPLPSPLECFAQFPFHFCYAPSVSLPASGPPKASMSSSARSCGINFTNPGRTPCRPVSRLQLRGARARKTLKSRQIPAYDSAERTPDPTYR